MTPDPYIALLRRVEALEQAEARRARLSTLAAATAKASPQTAKAVSALLAEAQEKFGVPVLLIGSECRAVHIVQARDWVIHEAHDMGISQIQIGRALGRDPSTIATAIDREKQRRSAQ